MKRISPVWVAVVLKKCKQKTVIKSLADIRGRRNSVAVDGVAAAAAAVCTLTDTVRAIASYRQNSTSVLVLRSKVQMFVIN